MKKSLIALLLVVALVVTVSVFAVSAEDIDFATNDGETVNGYCQHCKTNVDWVPFDQTVLTTGHYYLSDASLTEDTVSGLGYVYNVSSQMVVAAGNEICLHLNGNTLYRSGGAPFSLTGSTLAIMDHEDEEGMLRGRPWSSVDGGCITGGSSAAVYIYGGTIQPVLDASRAKAQSGGCINLSSSYLEINGGTITGGVASKAGGCINLSSSNLEINGGTISGGTATTSGGNINAASSSYLEINGGTITDGAATTAGGNINLAGTTTAPWSFKMTGGTISGGTATTNGGNINLTGASGVKQLAEITGGIITGGTATGNGGNISAGSDAEISLTNATVTAGTSNAAADATTSAKGGGNIFHSSGAHTIVGAGAVVSNGTAVGNGGNFCQVYGGGLGHSGVIVKDGGKVQGGTAAYGGSISSGNNGYVTVENGGEISGGTASTYGGNIYATKIVAINVNEGGTISGGTATANQGGNVYLNASSAALNLNGGTISGGSGKHGGNVMSNGGVVTLTSGTISGGTTTAYGGNVYNMGGKLYIKGATVTGGSASEGGNVYQSAGTTEMTSGTLTLGNTTSNGGNVNIKQSGGSFTFSGGTISEGSSGAYGGGFYAGWGATLNMSGDAKFENNAATNGGNIYGTGTNLQITGGTITGGTATTNGGNIALAGGSTYGSITGATISGGTAKAGGNIWVSATNSNQSDTNRLAGIVLGEGTTISGGTATGFGGNIYISNMYTVLTLDGAVLDGANATASHGDNIGVWNVDTLNIKGNTVIKNGHMYDSVYLGDCDDDNESDSDTFNLKVTLDGNANVDYIYFSGYPTDGYELCGLTIKEGFAGAAKLVWQATNLNADATLTKADFRKANTILPTHVTAEENYANAGTLYVLDNSSSQKPVAYFDTNADQTNELATTGMVGVDADGAEHAITAMPTDDTYAYVKLYGEGATIELTQDVVVDVNKMDVHFVTGVNKLTVIDWRTNSFDDAAASFTVDNEANLNRCGVNPVNGYQYVVVGDNTNGFSASRIAISINKVSIKPASAALYYTTTIKTNATLAPYVADYGVAVSLVNVPGENFMDDTSVLYTCIGLDETTEAINLTTRSALVENIIKTGLDKAENTARAEKPIYVSAYVTILGEDSDSDFNVVGNEHVEYTLRQLVEMIDADDALSSNPNVINMYDTWQNPMAYWDLTKIPAAWEAANAEA